MVSTLFAACFVTTIALSFWIPQHYPHVANAACPVRMRFKGYGIVYVPKAIAALFYASFWAGFASVLISIAMIWRYVSTGKAEPRRRPTASELTQLNLNGRR